MINTEKILFQMKLASITDLKKNKFLPPRVKTIAEYLKQKYPNDYIVELKKGRDTKEIKPVGRRYVTSRTEYNIGNHILIKDKNNNSIINYNPSETYRRNIELSEAVLYKIEKWSQYNTEEYIDSLRMTSKDFFDKYKKILDSK